MKVTQEKNFELDLNSLADLYKKALLSENKARIDFAEKAVTLAIEAEGAATRLAVAETALEILG